MKKYTFLFLPLILFVFHMSYSQEITGIATYKSFAKFDLKVDSTEVSIEMQKQITQLLKQQTQKEYELQFNNTESIFKEKEQLERPSNSMFSGMNVATSGGFGIYYNDLKESRYVNQKDLLGKLFLISNTIEKKDWKLEKETKSIGEYTCFKATQIRISVNDETGETNETLITAWYTPQIPIPMGPFNYSGLPGLILEIIDGNSSYLCSQIVLNPKNGVKIESPTKGKKVSKEIFEKIQMDKMKEMQENAPVGGKNIEIEITN